MADRAATAARRGALGPILIGVVVLPTAGLLFLPLMLLVLGALSALSGWFPALGDPTWNDGDAGLGLGFGGVSTVAVLAVAAGALLVVARRFRLPVRPWVFGGLGAAVALAAVGLWVAF